MLPALAAWQVRIAILIKRARDCAAVKMRVARVGSLEIVAAGVIGRAIDFVVA